MLAAQGVILDCKYSVENLQIIGDRYVCHAKVVDSSDLTRFEGVPLGHPIGKNNADVEGLFIENGDLAYIPVGLEEIFPNLKSITLRNSNLETISAEDLKPFPNLLSLTVESSNVDDLEGDLFKYTPHIQSIEFENNLISSVGEGLLSGLSDLKLAQFEGNTCIDIRAETPQEIRDEILPSICPAKKTTTGRTTARRTTTRRTTTPTTRRTSKIFHHLSLTI